ncbi:unnamed protein product [Trichobilharzia szidati]|nr:unnamed protein product [Trichobilharzia szidati]
MRNTCCNRFNQCNFIISSIDFPSLRSTRPMPNLNIAHLIIPFNTEDRRQTPMIKDSWPFHTINHKGGERELLSSTHALRSTVSWISRQLSQRQCMVAYGKQAFCIRAEISSTINPLALADATP